MVNRLDIGETVAAQMQQIIQSDEHKRVFFNKKASNKCCSCDVCGKDCSCSKCDAECKGCMDKAHVHDSNCAHDKTVAKSSAVNEMIELLQKISTIQDELGLVNSSLVTMQALATMVVELRKSAQEDTNDISFQDIVKEMDPDLKQEFKRTQVEDPEVIDLLRQRINESNMPFLEQEGVSADSASPIPSDYPDAVIVPDDNSSSLTWSPDAENSLTELAPESFVMERLPKDPTMPDFDRTLGERDFTPEIRDQLTVPVQRKAFDDLNALLNKQAQYDLDFEDEPDLDEEAEMAALLGEMPEGHSEISGSELEEMLLDEEDSDRELFDIPMDANDTMWASDLDEELEFGDFLAKHELPENLIHDPLHEEEDAGYGFTSEFDPKELEDLIRLPGGKEVKRVMLDPQEEADLENAHLTEQLDMDPDQLTDEEVYPGDWEDTPEELIGSSVADEIEKYDPGETPHALEQQYRFWND